MNELQILKQLVDIAGNVNQLSKIAGVNSSNIYQMLKGRLNISLKFLSGVATALNYTLNINLELKQAPQLFNNENSTNL